MPRPAVSDVEFAVVVELPGLDEGSDEEELALAVAAVDELGEFVTPELLTELHGTGVLVAPKAAGRPEVVELVEGLIPAVESRQRSRARIPRRARRRVSGSQIGYGRTLGTGSRAAEIRPKRRRPFDATRQRQAGLRHASADNPGDGEHYGRREESLHLDDRSP